MNVGIMFNKSSLMKSLVDRVCKFDKSSTPKMDADYAKFLDEISEEFIVPLYKLNRTSHVGKTGELSSNFAGVGLKEIYQSLTFNELFLDHLFLRLNESRDRGDGFKFLFDILQNNTNNPVIIETGTLRVPGNWDGDGQSTFLFDTYVSEFGGAFFSIDINIECIESARRVCSSKTNLILNDSVSAIRDIVLSLSGRPINLLYLDSFDVDKDNPWPSARHHVMELQSARNSIAAGTILCVDDYQIGVNFRGKAAIVDPLLNWLDIPVVWSGYQKIWQFSDEGVERMKDLRSLLPPTLGRGVLSISESSEWLAGGWHTANEWGVWSVDGKGIVFFIIEEEDTTPPVLSLLLRPFINEHHPKQTVTVTNGSMKIVRRRAFNKNKSSDFSLEMPLNYGLNIIEIKASRIESPLNLGISDDSRKLGVALVRAEIQ